ncbi:hypothetical protein hrd7_15550 [Leptolinea sp. HRD-7]|nr:hypothetical protein hrd7_15550 [Leptolinea sp. HRD-7]
MEDPNFDKNLFDLFSSVIDNENEVDILHQILLGKSNMEILDSFINKKEEGEDVEN